MQRLLDDEPDLGEPTHKTYLSKFSKANIWQLLKLEGIIGLKKEQCEVEELLVLDII